MTTNTTEESPPPMDPQPTTDAGKRLLGRRSYWRHNTAIRDAILDVELEAFWQGVNSVEEVHNPAHVTSIDGK